MFNLAVQILGGLALFLYGLTLLSKGLERIASHRLQEMLERFTDRPIKGVIFGATVTSIMQSSSLLMVTLIGLLNANLLTLHQAVGIILGMEIGTTMTAQLVSFKIWDAYLYLIIIGFFTKFFSKKDRIKLVGQVILGLGFIFLGMMIMSQGSKTINSIPEIHSMIILLSENLFLGVLAGAVFTALIQSSSAITGLVIAMGSAGTIGLPFAIALILGSNIGTCVTGIIASIGSKISAKRAAAAQVLINVVGVIIFLPIIMPYASFIEYTASTLPRQIANAHTIFNIIVSIIKFPFIALMVKFIEWLIPGKDSGVLSNTRYMDNKQLEIPSIALSNSVKEVNRLGAISLGMLRESRKAIVNLDPVGIKSVMAKEDIVDDISLKLHFFLNKLSVGDLTTEEMDSINRMRDNIIDIERVGDLAQDIAESAGELVEFNITLREKQLEYLKTLLTNAIETYETSLNALENQDRKAAEKVLDMEENIDSLYKEYRDEFKKTSKEDGDNSIRHTIFFDALRHIERVSDHANNIADSVLELD